MLVLGQHIQEFQFPVLAHLLSGSATSFDLVFPLFVSGIDHAMLSPFMLSISSLFFLSIFVLSCNFLAFKSLSLLFAA